jgi:Icc protein
MDRRKFIQHLGLGLAAGWACGRLAWPLKAWAAAPELRLALLADAHLKNGADRGPEAQALARAVAEINSLTPSPDLVLFAGDLAHQGRPDALDLGREILTDLSRPLWAVRGEGDCDPRSAGAWIRRYGEPRFSWVYGGVHFLGLDTAWHPSPQGPIFEIGAEQRRWLARELAGVDSATPLVIVSHAPLARLFHPWQQWTMDAPEIAPLLARFRQVLCLHGHTHAAGARDQGPGAWKNFSSLASRQGLPENQKPKSENLIHYSLPATAWPRPQAVQGTPAVVRPGQGPRGCGWALLILSPMSVDFRPYLWQA